MAGTHAFTCYQILPVPRPWPVSNALLLLNTKKGGMLHRLSGYPDGHLGFDFEVPEGTSRLHFDTQPLAIQGTGRILVTVNFDGSYFTVLLNGEQVKSLEEDASIFAVSTNDPVASGPIAIADPNANQACKAWIDWRKVHLGHSLAVGPNCVRRTDADQIAQLGREVELLHHFARSGELGQSYPSFHVAGRLRALLYWQITKVGDLNRNYNPLMLRLAARKDLPLPIFAFPDHRDSRPPDFPEPTGMLLNNPPMIRRFFPGQTLMDLQEWLDIPLSVDNTLQDEKSKVYTPLDILAALANKDGGAHYDEQVPIHLEMLNHTIFADVSFTERFIRDIADTVALLAEFIVMRLSMSIDRSNTSATLKRLKPLPCSSERRYLGATRLSWTSRLTFELPRPPTLPWFWPGVLSVPGASNGSKPFHPGSNQASISANETHEASVGCRYRLWWPWKREAELDP